MRQGQASSCFAAVVLFLVRGLSVPVLVIQSNISYVCIMAAETPCVVSVLATKECGSDGRQNTTGTASDFRQLNK